MAKKVEIKVTTRGVGETNKAIATIGTKFDKLKRSVGNAGAAMRKLGPTFKKAAIAGAAMAAGMAILIKRTLSAVDNLAKLSRNLTISTEALAAFDLQANLAGVSTEVMNKSLAKMLKNIGDAALGFGTAKTLLDRLNIDIQKLASLKPEEQFQFIADAMKNLNTQAEKIAFSTAIFGRQGVELIEVLEGGSKAFRAAARDTQLFGTAISAVDARKVEDFNDEMTRLKEVFKGFATRITVKFAEGMEPLIEKFIEAARESEGFKSEVNSLADAFSDLAISSVNSMSKIVQTFKDSRSFFDKHPLFKSTFQTQFPFTSKLFTSSKPEKKPEPSKPSIPDFLKTPKDPLKALVENARKANFKIKDDAEKAREQDRLNAIGHSDAKIKLFEEFTNKRKELTLSAKEFAIDQFNEEFGKFQELVDQGRITAEELEKFRLEGIKKISDGFKEAEEKGKQSLTELQVAMKEVSADMKDSLADFFETGEISFDSMVSSWRRKLAEFAADKIWDVLLNLLKGGGAGAPGKKGIFGLGGILGIFHKGGPVKNAPVRYTPAIRIPSFDTGGEVLAKLRTDEFVVSPKGTRAAGVNALNRINRGDLSDFGQGRGVDLTVNVTNVNVIQAIDTQTGADFLMRPESADAIEKNIERAIIENGLIREALKQGLA